MSATCRSRSKFGPCGRPAGNHLVHAVPIGDNVWFGYRASKALGYGKFRGGTFKPFPSAQRSAEGAHINEGDQLDG